MFQISEEELESLRSQLVTLKPTGRGRHSKYLPFAFTQEGIARLSSVIRSPGAIQANIAIMRVFVKLREHMLRTTSFLICIGAPQVKVEIIEDFE